ncbi:MAG: hypothetical protein NTW04_06130, partial [Elusimicrobia bacterium]|nr:hypothetical protein [Elusimicrobiota bacterium]
AKKAVASYPNNLYQRTAGFFAYLHPLDALRLFIGRPASLNDSYFDVRKLVFPLKEFYRIAHDYTRYVMETLGPLGTTTDAVTAEVTGTIAGSWARDYFERFPLPDEFDDAMDRAVKNSDAMVASGHGH